jgi:short-subunit dehydrogenase
LNAGQPAHKVNTASVTGLVALEAVGPVYTASKYAVVGLSEVLQQELATTEIGVSILCPGAVSTRILESERNRPGGGPADGQKKEFTESDETYTRMIEPGGVATMVLEAVEADQLYVVTHPEWYPLYSKRNSSLENAFNQ